MAEKILIVDDEPVILELMVAALEASDYIVVSCPNGKEAMEVIKDNTFDLLVTDIIMPEVDGLDLIDHVISTSPNISVLAISGGGKDKEGGDLLESAMVSGADAVLEKPFRPDELVRTVRAMLR